MPKEEQEPRKKMNPGPDRWTGARASLQCCWHRTACLYGYACKVTGRGGEPVDKDAELVLWVTESGQGVMYDLQDTEVGEQAGE